MSIKNPKKGAFGPIFNIFFTRWLHNIEHNTYPILIIISNNSLVGISSIPCNTPIFPHTAFCWFPGWKVNTGWVKGWACTKEQRFNVQFLEFGVLGGVGMGLKDQGVGLGLGGLGGWAVGVLTAVVDYG